MARGAGCDMDHRCRLTSVFSVAFLVFLATGTLGQTPEGFRPQAPLEVPPTNRQADPNRADLSTPPRNSPRPARSGSRDSYVRLARAPNMFGDTLPPLVSYIPSGQTGIRNIGISTALNGGASYNIAENNTSIPTDRVYFMYNAFYNALATNVPDPVLPQTITNSVDLHRYVLGFEKTFLDGDMSLDVRMPFFSGLDASAPLTSVTTGNVGNLAMYLKGLVYIDENVAVATGVGLGLPTGSDVQMQNALGSMTIENESVRIMPFVAMTSNLNDSWFLQYFNQLNFAASGSDVVADRTQVGVFTEQSLLQFDLGLGRWLWRNGSMGLAAVSELHYTSTMQDSDQVIIPLTNSGGGQLLVPANRLDILNMTMGAHMQLTPMSTLRVGAVAPLKSDPDRVFDSELQVYFNRFF